MADTRKDKRAPVSLKVRFKSATVDEFIEHYCKDVSRGGIFIKSSQPMPVGTLLKFQFQLKDESQLIKGVGRVVWTRSEERAGPERPSGMGIKFIKMDNESRVMVERIITATEGSPGAYEEGRGPDGSIDSELPPAQEATSGNFFPDLPPAELPPPEDRTAVREAAEFLAAALSEATDEAAAREAEQKANEARKRTAEIEAQRVAAAEEQRKAQTEGLPSMIIDPGLSSPPQALDTSSSLESERPDAVKNSSLPPPPAAAVAAARPPAPPPGPAAEAAAPKAQAPMPMPVPVAAAPTVPLHTGPSVPAGGPKKSPVLPIAAIAAVLVVAGFVALRGGPNAGEPQASAIDAPQLPVQPVQPEPVEPEPLEPEPAAEAAPENVEPEPAQPEPEAEPVELVQLRVSTLPVGAEIVVDGQVQGKAPLALDLAKDVAVNIEARLPAHQPVSQELTPTNGSKPLRLTLKALPFVLHVETTPPGAAVNVSGKRGTSPVDLTWSEAPKSSLKAVAKLAGYENAEAPLTLEAFEQGEEAMKASLSLSLNALPEKPAAPVVKPKPAPAAKPQASATSSDSSAEPGQAAEPKPAEPKAEEPKPAEPKPAPTEPKPAEPLPDNPFG